MNTSRGPIVDEAALIAALSERRIAGAGLDVFDNEPPPADHPLRKLDNVTLTPHLGYVTRETLAAFYGDMPAAVTAFARGAPVRVINTDVIEHAPPAPAVMTNGQRLLATNASPPTIDPSDFRGPPEVRGGNSLTRRCRLD